MAAIYLVIVLFAPGEIEREYTYKNMKDYDMVKHSVWVIAMSVIDTLRKIDSDRVVFLGGEPTEQDKKDLLKLMHILNKEKVRIWLYTGRDFDDIDPAIRDQCETIKCGRYVAELAQPGFPASSNQKVFRKNVFDDFEDITNHFREEQ